MIFILFDYKCFVIFKNSEANFVTAIELAYIYKKWRSPILFYSSVSAILFLKFAHAQCKCLEFLAMYAVMNHWSITTEIYQSFPTDLSPYERNFLSRFAWTKISSPLARKSITKLVLFRTFVAKCCKMRII